ERSAVALARPRRAHARREARCRLAGRAGQLRVGKGPHLDPDVDPIEQGAREAACVSLQLRGSTGTAASWIAPETAKARVHRRDELEAGGKSQGGACARDRDPAFLERLAQGFEDPPLELRQL